VERVLLTRVAANLGICGYIIHNKLPVLIKDNADKWASSHGIQPLGETAYSWLGVPLLLGNQVLGVINIQDYHKENVYDEHDRDLLMTIASSAAVALQNALLFSEKKRTELETAQRTDQIKSLLTPVLESAARLGRLATTVQAEPPDLRRCASEISSNLAEILLLLDRPGRG